MKIGIITGSGFYDFPELSDSSEQTVATPFGKTILSVSERNGHHLYFIARHGKGHSHLPNMINHRAHLLALKECGVDLIIATSIMGILDKHLPMASLCLFDDLFFIDNRLPNGEICSVYTRSGDTQRGHYLFGQPISIKANQVARDIAREKAILYNDGLVHSHANGPRFNSKAEIVLMKNCGCSTVSQTVGPEIILAGELEIGYLLLGFGVDYANGIKDEPTPVEVLNKNMGKSKQVFSDMILGITDAIKDDAAPFFDNGFVYRFE